MSKYKVFCIKVEVSSVIIDEADNKEDAEWKGSFRLKNRYFGLFDETYKPPKISINFIAKPI